MAGTSWPPSGKAFFLELLDWLNQLPDTRFEPMVRYDRCCSQQALERREMSNSKQLEGAKSGYVTGLVIDYRLMSVSAHQHRTVQNVALHFTLERIPGAPARKRQDGIQSKSFEEIPMLT